MSRNGSGVYTLPAGNPVVTLTQISSTWANNTLSDIATEITNSIDKSGRTVPTANLPMAGYKHTGAGAATATGQYLTYGQAGGLASLTIPRDGAGIGYNLTDAITVDGVSVPHYGLSIVDFDATSGFGAGLWLSGYGEVRIGNFGATVIRISGGNNIAITGNAQISGALSVAGALSASNVLSGTYTPTVANQSNITSVAVLAAQYMRVGNVVTVSGQCAITPASAAAATFSLSLPVAVTGVLGETHKVAGVCAVPGADLAPRIRGSGLAATQVAWISATYPGTSGYVASYQFTYLLE